MLPRHAQELCHLILHLSGEGIDAGRRETSPSTPFFSVTERRRPSSWESLRRPISGGATTTRLPVLFLFERPQPRLPIRPKSSGPSTTREDLAIADASMRSFLLFFFCFSFL